MAFNDIIDEHICNSVMSMKYTTSTKKNYRVWPLSKRLPTRIKFNLLIIVFGMQKDSDPLKTFMHIHLSSKYTDIYSNLFPSLTHLLQFLVR